MKMKENSPWNHLAGGSGVVLPRPGQGCKPHCVPKVAWDPDRVAFVPASGHLLGLGCLLSPSGSSIQRGFLLGTLVDQVRRCVAAGWWQLRGEGRHFVASPRVFQSKQDTIRLTVLHLCAASISAAAFWASCPSLRLQKKNFYIGRE